MVLEESLPFAHCGTKRQQATALAAHLTPAAGQPGSQAWDWRFETVSCLMWHHFQGTRKRFWHHVGCYLLPMLGQVHAEQSKVGFRYLSGRKYACWGRSQINYILGNNGRSYAVGLGNMWPQYAAHPAASCSSSMQPCASLVSLSSSGPASPACMALLIHFAA